MAAQDQTADEAAQMMTARAKACHEMFRSGRVQGLWPIESLLQLTDARFAHMAEAVSAPRRRSVERLEREYERAMEYLNTKEAAKIAEARSWLYTLVGDYIELASIPVETLPMPTAAKNHIEKKAATIVKREETIKEKKRKWKAEQDRLTSGLVNDAREIAATSIKLGMAGARLVRAPFRLAALTTNALGISKNFRRLAYATAIGSGLFYAFQPVPAEPHATVFLGDRITENDREMACRDIRNLQKSDPMTIGFALAFYPDEGRKNHDARLLHWHSAMRAIKRGVSPMAVFAVSALETLNFTDVLANNSSASGPYQSITETKLAWLMDYYQELPSYQEAKARLDANKGYYAGRESDVTMTKALESLGNADRKDVLSAFRTKTVNHAFHTAFLLADTPIIGGDLMAAYVKDKMPELMASSLHKGTWENFHMLVTNYYMIHLLGDAGAGTLQTLARTAPNTKMNTDKITGVRLRYFVDVAAGNQGIFPGGNANITAREFAGLIAKYVEGYAKPVWNKSLERMQQLEAGDAACIRDFARFRNVVPAETSRAELAYRQHLSPETRSAIEGFIADRMIDARILWEQLREGSKQDKPDEVRLIIQKFEKTPS